MAHQVFISYAIEDKSIADAVCKALEQGGVKCWYAPRDVPYAVDYEEAIVDAIAESKLMLLVLSSHSNDSKHVKREVQNASREEPQVPVLPFQIEDVALNKSLKYYIGSVHWLSALTPPLEDHLEKLVGYVQQRLPQPPHEPASEAINTERAKSAVKEDKEALPAAMRPIKAEDEVRPKPKWSQSAQPLEDESDSLLVAIKRQTLLRSIRFVEIACLGVLMVCVLAWFRILPLSTYVVSRAILPGFIGLLTILVAAILIKTKATSQAPRAKLFFIIAGLMALGLYALLLAGTGVLAWRAHQFIVTIGIVVFVFALITFVRNTSVPAPRLRAMVPVIITTLVVPAVFALIPIEFFMFFNPLSRLGLLIGLAFLVFVVILFVRKTRAPQNLKLVVRLSMAACVAILLGMRLDLERLDVEQWVLRGRQELLRLSEKTTTPTPTPAVSPLLTAKDNDTQGREFFSQQKYAEAEPYYREAVRMEPNNANYNNNLGTALYGLRRYDEAELFFQQALRSQPNDPLLRANLADALYEQRKYADAEFQYSEARRLSPGVPRYEEGLRKARAALGIK